MSDDKQKALLDAVKQTLLHLNTNIDLGNHPKDCCCYGCNLRKAYFDIQVTAFSCNPESHP